MMEKDANYFLVGLFVSLSLLILVCFLIWLAGAHDDGHHSRYTVYFTDPVSGLSEDGVVKYKGVDVGKVLAMRLSDRSDLVKVDIEVKDTTLGQSGDPSEDRTSRHYGSEFHRTDNGSQ